MDPNVAIPNGINLTNVEYRRSHTVSNDQFNNHNLNTNYFHDSEDDCASAPYSTYQQQSQSPLIKIASSRRKKRRDKVDRNAVITIDLSTYCHWLGIAKKEKPYIWCVKNDCCGLLCIFFTYLLLFYGEFAVTFVMLLSVPYSTYKVINLILYQSVVFLAFTSHVRAMFTDPGAIPLNNATIENIRAMGFKEGQVVYKCPKCESIKPDRTHHCSTCHRCISKMDHHCPWVNNCIGENNLKHFILFLVYTMLMSIYGVCLSISHIFICVGSSWNECRVWSPTTSILTAVFAIIEGIIFAIFTGSMLYSQLESIFYDETGIEHLQHQSIDSDDEASDRVSPETSGSDESFSSNQELTKFQSLQAVFGNFSITWFSPFHNPDFKNLDNFSNSSQKHSLTV